MSIKWNRSIILFKKYPPWGWRGGSKVKNICCSYGGSRSSSQHPWSSSFDALFCTPSDPALTCTDTHIHTHLGIISINILKNTETYIHMTAIVSKYKNADWNCSHHQISPLALFTLLHLIALLFACCFCSFLGCLSFPRHSDVLSCPISDTGMCDTVLKSSPCQ